MTPLYTLLSLDQSHILTLMVSSVKDACKSDLPSIRMMKLAILPPWWELNKVLFMRWHMIQEGQWTQLTIQHHWGDIQDKLVQPVVQAPMYNVQRLLIAPDVVFVQHVVQLCPVLLLRLQLLQQIAVVVLIQQRWEVEHYLFKELTNLCTREI